MLPIPLPPAALRIGVPSRKADEEYLASATRDADLLARFCEVGPHSTILDVGCGQARLLYGLLLRFNRVERYVGLDVAARSIEWLNENAKLPFVEFYHIDYQNERYNKGGSQDVNWPTLGTFDCATLLSVFTHMRLHDIERHLTLLAGSVRPFGYVLLSAFVEDAVPDEEENPSGYLQRWRGPLHCVRLNRQTFEGLASKSGFEVCTVQHREGHPALYALQRRTDCWSAGTQC